MTDSTVKLLQSHWLFMVRLNALLMVAYVWSRSAMRNIQFVLVLEFKCLMNVLVVLVLTYFRIMHNILIVSVK